MKEKAEQKKKKLHHKYNCHVTCPEAYNLMHANIQPPGSIVELSDMQVM